MDICCEMRCDHVLKKLSKYQTTVLLMGMLDSIAQIHSYLSCSLCNVNIIELAQSGHTFRNQ